MKMKFLSKQYLNKQKILLINYVADNKVILGLEKKANLLLFDLKLEQILSKINDPSGLV